jgi:hypothetical protein
VNFGNPRGKFFVGKIFGFGVSNPREIRPTFFAFAVECGGSTPLLTGRLDGQPQKGDPSSRVVQSGVTPPHSTATPNPPLKSPRAAPGCT